MARFLPLNFRPGRFLFLAGTFPVAASCLALLRADPATNAAPPAQVTVMSPPATAPAKPPAPPDAYTRYGQIVAPSNEAAHPLKLNMPFPGVGEVKVPSQQEIQMREKLEQLATLSDTDIRAQLEQWPAYSRMNLHDEGTMLQRIEDFQNYRTKTAMQKAHDLGLLSTMTQDQKDRFEKDYWTLRLQMDSQLAKQFEPILKAREQQMQQQLFREFSVPSAGPIAQVPKPPAPNAANKPTPPPPAPIPPGPALTSAPPPATQSPPH